MNTRVARTLAPVHLPSPEELREAEQRLLHDCGFTRQQLEEQAQQGRFETETAKRAWFSLA